MRLRIVTDINSAWTEQGERLVQQGVLACSSVGEDEIEGIQQVPTPVPVPISSSRPPGFKAAMTRSKAPTGGRHQP